MNYGCRVVYVHLDELVYLYNKMKQLILMVEYFLLIQVTPRPGLMTVALQFKHEQQMPTNLFKN